MSFKTVTVENDEGVAVVTLNRPDKMNAMNPQLHEDITQVLEQLRYDDAVRVLVLTGAGTAFCAGMDLKEIFHELKDRPAAYDHAIRMATEWRGRTLRYYPKPTIAMVNGYCFGGAFSIVEACDVAVAADEATFGLSEINFDGFPGGSVSKSLANALHPRDALFYAMTGRKFGGQRAAEIKLVNFPSPLRSRRGGTRAIAREIAAKDPDSLRATKDAYRFSLEMSWEASMDYTAAKEVKLAVDQDVGWKDGGVADFVEGKYKPGFEGRKKAKKK